jgi:hypothetical protein
MALLAGETVEMVDVGFGSHDHLKGRNGFATSGAITRRPEHSLKIENQSRQRKCIHNQILKPFIIHLIPEVISFAENQIGFGVEGGADFSQSTIATSALETVLVPKTI